MWQVLEFSPDVLLSGATQKGEISARLLALDGNFSCWVSCELRFPTSVMGPLHPMQGNVSVMGASEGATA